MTSCLFVYAEEGPLRLAVAGVTHGHLWEVVSRMNRGDFKIVGVAEPRDEYRANNELARRLDASLFYADLGRRSPRWWWPTEASMTTWQWWKPVRLAVFM